jgi:hypothetical protein
MYNRFLITLIFIISTLFSFGQDFARATYYEFGFVDTLTQEVDWSNKVKMDPALVTLGSRNLKIHTEKFQQFFFKSSKYELSEVKGYYYHSYTADGKKCVIYIYTEDDGLNYLEIEYQNYIIRYHLKNLE